MDDLISREAALDKFIDGLEEIFADIRERHVDDSVCGLCEYDGAYLGQSGDWCNECPGFEKDDCFKLSDKTRKKWTDEIIKELPSAEPKKGKWEITEAYPHNVYCSECHVKFAQTHWAVWEDGSLPRKFCPNCGVRMEVSK